YGVRILEGAAEDDTAFVFIASIDEGDDWQDESCWQKANPNLGISVKLEDLRRKAAQAKEMGAGRKAFRRVHLSEWTGQVTRAIDLRQWDAAGLVAGHPVDAKRWRDDMLAKLRGQQCRGGLDLGSASDLTALALLFGTDDEGYDVLLFCWVPEESAR